MSRENVETVQRLYDAFNGGDTAMGLAQLDPAVELQDYPALPDAEWHQGHDGAIRWVAKIWGVAGRCTFGAAEFIEADDGRLIVRTVVTAAGKRAGVPVTLEGTGVYTLRNSKILRLEIFASKAEALEAVGLGELSMSRANVERQAGPLGISPSDREDG